ncbi:Uncharacterised protein [Mycobacterium tuberculosis]|uniref:Uncharacterized protein n=1 Tax=Mycobacterium tuberculosis TaxID=1773 RepID=A0A655A651_MYCTX|nr:Uncharacterised protein [Mycobacterium tuberculosis]CFS34376.1 Uncharacterised protein [Mycobacterium tuberculosis]CKQ99879.1 Uncharacterised protein [Mycobacterium tuberculosis]CKR52433.1 Uncharacterised protein [Mycobacterium tuberculosis]CKR94832.1 Uncharacterised protein [Mycobacterium tuberculosis]
MHIVENIFSGKNGALRQTLPAGTMHRKNRHDNVQAEFVMQLPGAEHREIQRGPAHLGAVYTNQPGTRLWVPQ